MSDSEKHLFFMQKALDMAHEAKGTTFPNPAVGAVIVSHNRVIAHGATEKCGGKHAEIVALHQAGDNARGSTLYVTLEPCCHHGRTSPCIDSIISHGIKRVFVAMEDPNPLVQGKSIKILQNEGIEVNVGLLATEATRLNEDFLWDITQKKAWITLKLALTLDGKIADYKGDSKWITSSQSREFVQLLRKRHAAVGVGITTLQMDDPKLTARCEKTFFPARIVFSPDETLPANSFFIRNASQVRSVVVLRGGEQRIETSSDGVELWHTGEKDPLRSLHSFVAMAHQQHLSSILIEGGQRLGSLFLQAGLVNRIYLFYGNKILGRGKEGLLFSSGLSIDKCITLENTEHLVFGSDIMITGKPVLS